MFCLLEIVKVAKSQADIHFGRLLKRLSSTFQPNVRKLLRIVIDKIKNSEVKSHLYSGGLSKYVS